MAATSTDPADLLDLALELADVADRITLRHWRSADLVVDTKPDMTPVSDADRAVEDALRERLRHAVPDHAVHGEEAGVSGGEQARWIIDPIDGTKGYVRGLPVWATLIALEEAGEVLVGVVSAPALGSRWWAARGHGAFHDGHAARVSRIATIADAQLSFSWDRPDRFDGGFGTRALALSHRCWRTRGYGDFWQHALVADGAIDIAAEPSVEEWDVAPLKVIVEEAGGRFTDLAGRARIDGGSVVCTNGLLHDEVLAALGPDVEPPGARVS